MIKRILKVIVWAVCFPILVLVVLCLPIVAIYILAKYITTGKEDLDLFFTPIEWAMNLPSKITKNW